MSVAREGKCIFCGREGGLTAEHPMSKRVLDLAGFGWDDMSVIIDKPIAELTPDYLAERMSTVNDEIVRCVCAPCNNEWMQNLDHSFAGTVDRWVQGGSHRLGIAGVAVVRRYLAKVMWVRLLGEQWSAGPIRDGHLITEVVLNPKFGASILSGDLVGMADQLSLGAARVDSASIFTHAAFTPRVAGLGRRAGFQRFSAGLVVALPKLELQLWLVYRFAPSMRTTWPAEISWLTAASRYDRLRSAPSKPYVEDVELCLAE